MTLRRQTLFAILLLCALPMLAQKQSRMALLFSNTPADLIPALSQDLKVELVKQYYTQEPTEKIRNVYGGPCRITKITDTYLRLELDSTMVVELKEFRSLLRPTRLAMGVTSTIRPAISVLTFYDSEWTPISGSSLVELPQPEQFLINPADSTRLDYKKALVERGTWDYAASFDADSPTLTFRITTFDEEMAAKQHPIVTSLLKDKITYRWKNNRFVPQP